jgi:hypothetical protein
MTQTQLPVTNSWSHLQFISKFLEKQNTSSRNTVNNVVIFSFVAFLYKKAFLLSFFLYFAPNDYLPHFHLKISIQISRGQLLYVPPSSSLHLVLQNQNNNKGNGSGMEGKKVLVL